MPRSSDDAQPRVRRLADLAKRNDVALVANRARTISDVAFDAFVVEPDALDVRGTLLERGTNTSGQVLAAASVEWPDMPIGWTAIQSRRGDDHLRLDDDDETIGHARFDRAFAVDTDDPDAFAALFDASLLEWIVDLDAEYGPLTILFDGSSGVDRRGGPAVPAIFVSRLVSDDAEFVATAKLAATLADHVSASIQG